MEHLKWGIQNLNRDLVETWVTKLDVDRQQIPLDTLEGDSKDDREFLRKVS